MTKDQRWNFIASKNQEETQSSHSAQVIDQSFDSFKFWKGKNAFKKEIWNLDWNMIEAHVNQIDHAWCFCPVNLQGCDKSVDDVRQKLLKLRDHFPNKSKVSFNKAYLASWLLNGSNSYVHVSFLLLTHF